jgi:hypothetical protein
MALSRKLEEANHAENAPRWTAHFSPHGKISALLKKLADHS